MKQHVRAVASPVILAFLFVALGASLAVAASPAPPPSPVGQDLHEQIRRDGWGRVLVHLRTPAGRAHVPEGVLSSQAAVSLQRADILAVQGTVLAKLGATDHRVVHRYQSVPYLALEVGPDALRELAAAGFHVARVVEDQLVFPMLPDSVPLIQANQVWARGYDGTGTVIAMIDTGVEPSHQFLTGKVVDEACFSSGAYPLCPRGGTQEVGPGSGLMCVLINECEHGTMTSGIAAGNGARAAVSFSGVAGGAKIASYQVFSGFDCGQPVPCIGAYESDIMAALERVLSLRTTYNFASVNMSLGGGRFTTNCDDDPLKPVIDNLRSFGIATIIATGNNSWTDAISFPACISSAISVGSTFKDGTIDTFWTNAAPFMTFFAPGVSVLTSWIDQMFDEIFPLFAQSSGTSLAAPHVSGAWALLKQAMPGASVDDVLAALQATGKPVTDTRPGGTVTKPLIQVEAALDRLLGPTGPLLAKLTPDNAVAGGSDFTLTADGGNFVVGSTVLVNGASRVTTLVSTSRLTAAIPASDIAALGAASISVRNPDGRVSNALPLSISVGPCLTGEYFAEYFGNNMLAAPASRTVCERPANEWEPFIRANWGTAGPDGVPVDNFSVRWTGRFRFGETRDYLFRTFVLDTANELRVYVDGALILDVTQARIGFQTATRAMTAGLHEIKIEYQERGGAAGVRVEWFHLAAGQPAVTGLVPAVATAGGPAFTLTAEGTDFRPGATLYWNGSAQATTVASDTRLSASIPASFIAAPGAAWVTVRNADDQRTFGQSFTIADPASTVPTLTALTPDGAVAGDPAFTMIVDGTKFVAGATVLWAGAPRSTTFVSSTRLMASIPASDVAFHNTFQVTVRNPDGQTSNGVAFVVALRPVPAPTLSAMTPNTATAGSAGFSLTLDGSNLDDVGVYWNGAFRVTRPVSSTRVTADIPASDLAVAGTFPVDVRRVISGQASNRLNFTVTGGSGVVTVTALSPSTATEGGPAFTLTVDGANFVSGATVLWNGSDRTTTFMSANRVTASIPASDIAAAGSASVSVRNPNSQVSNAQTFTIAAAPPLVVSFVTPAEGATVTGEILVRGTETGANGTPIAFTLVIDGAQFASSTGTLTGFSFYWTTTKYANGPHTLVATVQDGAGRTATATLHLTVTGSTAPTTTTLSPNTAPAGSPAFTLTVDGTNFVSGATVLWNGAVRTTTFVSATRVMAAIAAADIAAAGSASVTVRNPDLGLSNAQTFTITTSAPLIVSFTSPAEGATVTGGVGVGMSTTGAVAPVAFTLAIDGTQVDSFSSGTATEWLSWWDTSGYSPGSHTLVVTARDAAGRTATATRHATVAGGGPPVTTALSPNTAMAGGGDFPLTVDGTNFVSGGTVLWNGTVRTTTVVSATRVLASIAAADIATAGSASVTVRNPDGQVSNAQTFTITPAPAPTLTTLTPNTATAGGQGFGLAADGTNFASGATLLWNGSPRPTTWVSPTLVTASIATADIATAGTVSVSVRNPDLRVTNAQTFTIAAPPPPLVASFTAPADGATVSGTVAVGMSETGAGGTPISFTLTIDGAQVVTTSGTATTASFSWNTAGYAIGSHTLGLTVRDGAGRTATATRNVTVTSTDALRVAITQPGADGATVSATTWLVLWVEGAAAGGKTYTLSVGGTTVATANDTSSGPISIAWDTRGVNDGSATVIASARDSGGNTGSAARVVSVSNGQQPLVASFTSPAEGAMVSGTVTVGMAETGANGTPVVFTLTVDGTQIFTTSGTASTASFNWNANSVADGAHTLGLTVRDGAGRTATATRNVTVAALPSLTASITSPAEGATVSGPVVVGMSETGGTGTIGWTLRLDGGATPIYTTSGTAGTASFGWDTTAVAPGAHRLDLTVQDGGGRTATVTRNVTVQQPVTGSIRIFITQPGADGATVSGTVWFTIWIENVAAGSKTYTLSVDGTVVDSTSTTSNGPVSMAWTSSGAPNGSHMATVTVRDSVGATGSAGRTLSVQN